jgi:hypothetical protein
MKIVLFLLASSVSGFVVINPATNPATQFAPLLATRDRAMKPATQIAPPLLAARDTPLESRADFLSNAAILTGVSALTTLSFSLPAEARGRATLEQAYDRYTPRIIAGGQYYTSEFKKLVEKNDWAGLKDATSDPPKKSKEDRVKMDGGVSERAKQAGQFSDARVVSAADLFAATFSDNSISPKTKKMKAESAKLREVIDGINVAAREAMGEESSGGLFGLGAKKPSQTELAKRVRQFYVEGGNAYNQYIFAANEELPLSLKKLPYLK